jgi:hypothetical protein
MVHLLASMAASRRSKEKQAQGALPLLCSGLTQWSVTYYVGTLIIILVPSAYRLSETFPVERYVKKFKHGVNNVLQV